jgi:hypothetical protein
MKLINSRIDFFKDNPGMVIAELGVFKGDFTRELLECSPLVIWMVDTWSGAMSCGDKDGKNISDIFDMEAVYIELVDELCYPNVNIFRGKSIDFLTAIEDNYLDCVYIDTTHEFEMTRDELNLSLDKVKRGGWITGHDYNVIEVQTAVDSFCQLHDLKINYLSEDGNPSFYIKNLK